MAQFHLAVRGNADSGPLGRKAHPSFETSDGRLKWQATPIICLQIVEQLGRLLSMAGKHQSSERTHRNGHATGHGHFQHTAKPAKFATVLKAYNISQGSFQELQTYVRKHLGSTPAHAK